ncbi:Fas apoptotic inhibitory molecule 2, partial [Cichlidogyrus casuarinus]
MDKDVYKGLINFLVPGPPSLEFLELEVRNGFIKKVYAILTTCAFSLASAILASSSSWQGVVIGFMTSLVCCIVTTLIAWFTNFDFTRYYFYIFTATMVFSFYTAMTFTVEYFFGPFDYLAYDTQRIIGSKTMNISAEEYIVASIELYLDAVQILLFMVQFASLKLWCHKSKVTDEPQD